MNPRFERDYKPIEPPSFAYSLRRGALLGSGLICGGWVVHGIADGLEAAAKGLAPERFQHLADYTDVTIYGATGLLVLAGARLANSDAGHADAYRTVDYKPLKPESTFFERVALRVYNSFVE